MADKKVKVLVEMQLQYVIECPQDWKESSEYSLKDIVENHRNDSTWCTSNAIPEIEELTNRLAEKEACFCGMTKFKFIREATQEDINRSNGE